MSVLWGDNTFMNVYLAGTYTRPYLFEENTPLYVLESYYYILPWQIQKLKLWKGFILDSGAYTFMASQKDAKIKWEEYVCSYADFIKKNNIQYFLELDIDKLVGLEKVETLREILEKHVGRKCIPVWHKSRGIEKYKELCRNYDYVAIGGIVVKEITKDEYPVFSTLIQIAKQNNCKIHGLGFTRTDLLKTYHFYSVDSSSWLSGSRYAHIQYFDGSTIKYKTDKSRKMVNYKIVDDFIVKEWIKYQKYAETHL